MQKILEEAKELAQINEALWEEQERIRLEEEERIRLEEEEKARLEEEYAKSIGPGEVSFDSEFTLDTSMTWDEWFENDSWMLVIYGFSLITIVATIACIIVHCKKRASEFDGDLSKIVKPKPQR